MELKSLKIVENFIYLILSINIIRRCFLLSSSNDVGKTKGKLASGVSLDKLTKILVFKSVCRKGKMYDELFVHVQVHEVML